LVLKGRKKNLCAVDGGKKRAPNGRRAKNKRSASQSFPAQDQEIQAFMRLFGREPTQRNGGSREEGADWCSRNQIGRQASRMEYVFTATEIRVLKELHGKIHCTH
jgi:hypothetical protein